ncbi:hypothetical protein IQ252_25860 [Tychonema sp. LEGE 07203]|nr:hypothetical protein [Tychonema sp. LEGE 07203]
MTNNLTSAPSVPELPVSESPEHLWPRNIIAGWMFAPNLDSAALPMPKSSPPAPNWANRKKHLF